MPEPNAVAREAVRFARSVPSRELVGPGVRDADLADDSKGAVVQVAPPETHVSKRTALSADRMCHQSATRESESEAGGVQERPLTARVREPVGVEVLDAVPEVSLRGLVSGRRSRVVSGRWRRVVVVVASKSLQRSFRPRRLVQAAHVAQARQGMQNLTNRVRSVRHLLACACDSGIFEQSPDERDGLSDCAGAAGSGAVGVAAPGASGGLLAAARAMRLSARVLGARG